MSTLQNAMGKMTNYRWTICAMLFFATTINYLDRQVLSLTWDEFIKPEFHWNESHYGIITAVFSIVYAICMLFAGRFIDWMGTKKGYLWSIGIWSAGACLHAFCGIITEEYVGMHSAAELIAATGDVVVVLATISMYCFLVARCILALGEAGNFPAAIKVTAEYFPKKDRAYATSIFNAGASIGALIAPLSIPLLAKAWGWEMAFVIIGALGFVWMGFWVFMYTAPSKNKFVNSAELEYIEQDKHETYTATVKENEEKKSMTFRQCFTYRQTWAFAFGKFMTDGVWWFFLFWAPSYLNTQFDKFFDLLCHAVENACVNTEAFRSLQRFATQLKQNAFVHGLCIGSHVSFLRLSTIKMGVNSGDIVCRIPAQRYGILSDFRLTGDKKKPPSGGSFFIIKTAWTLQQLLLRSQSQLSRCLRPLRSG